MIYDSGDYPECQRRALAAAGWADFPARREAARREGRLLGIGLCELRRGHRARPVRKRRRSASGRPAQIVVTTGATAQGQGVKTMLAQIAADVLRVAPADDPRRRRRHRGEPARPRRLREPPGGDRRQRRAPRRARSSPTRSGQPAASLMEASPDDLELAGGAVRVKGVPGMQRSFARDRPGARRRAGLRAARRVCRRGSPPRSISSRRR